MEKARISGVVLLSLAASLGGSGCFYSIADPNQEGVYPCVDDADCMAGFKCTADGTCRRGWCGDGELDEGEQCDDGNAALEPCPAGTTTCVVCNASCQEVEVSNHPPTAAVGADQASNGGERVWLDGTGSSDPEGGRLAYLWRQIGGAGVDLIASDTATPYFEAPNVDSDLMFELVVEDGVHASAPVTTTVSSVSFSGPPLPRLRRFSDRRYDTSGSATAVVVKAGLAYVADGSEGLQIFSIRSGGVPMLNKQHRLEGAAQHIALMGNHAVVVGGHGSSSLLSVVNILDPFCTETNDQHSLFYEPSGIAVDDRYAYIGQGVGGLLILDLSDPANVAHASRLQLGGVTSDVAVIEDRVFVARGEEGLSVINVADRTAPAVSGGVELSGGAHHVALDPPAAWVTDGQALHLLDISGGSHLALVASLAIPDAGPMHIDGDTIWVAAGARGVVAVRREGAQLSLEREVDTLGFAQGLATVDGELLVADGAAGLVVYDMSSLPAPSRAGATPSDVRDGQGVALHGQQALAAAGRVVELWDVDTPEVPELRGQLELSDRVQNLLLTEEAAIIAAGSGGVIIASTAAATALQRLGSYDISGLALDVAMHGSRLYVADAHAGIIELSLEDLSSPRRLSTFTDVDRPVAIAADEGRLYALDDAGVLRVLAPRSGDKPELIGQLAVPAEGSDLVVARGYAYVAAGGAGVVIVDVTNPGAPVEVGRYVTESPAVAIAVAGSRAYVAAESEGLVVLDIAAAAAPRLVQSAALHGGRARGVAVGAEHAWINGTQLRPWPIRTVNLNGAVVWAAPTSVVDYDVTYPAGLVGEASLSCLTTGGRCAIATADPQQQRATVSWTLPQAPGDFELAIIVTGPNAQLSARDRVRVDGPDPWGDAPMCSERAAAGVGDVQIFADVGYAACARDSDCVLARVGVDCDMGRCPMPLAAESEPALQAMREQVNGSYCRDYVARGCPIATAGCLHVRPYCDHGTCKAQAPFLIACPIPVAQ